MECVILSECIIPGTSVRGPILTPQIYSKSQILAWIGNGIDVREVMSDGSYRKLSFIDEKVNSLDADCYAFNRQQCENIIKADIQREQEMKKEEIKKPISNPIRDKKKESKSEKKFDIDDMEDM